MPLPASTPRKQFERYARNIETASLPEFPKIPDVIKNANPKLREAWEKYEADLQDYFTQQFQRGI